MPARCRSGRRPLPTPAQRGRGGPLQEPRPARLGFHPHEIDPARPRADPHDERPGARVPGCQGTSARAPPPGPERSPRTGSQTSRTRRPAAPLVGSRRPRPATGQPTRDPTDGPTTAETVGKHDRAAIAGPNRSQEPCAANRNTTDRHAARPRAQRSDHPPGVPAHCRHVARCRWRLAADCLLFDGPHDPRRSRRAPRQSHSRATCTRCRTTSSGPATSWWRTSPRRQEQGHRVKRSFPTAFPWTGHGRPALALRALGPGFQAQRISTTLPPLLARRRILAATAWCHERPSFTLPGALGRGGRVAEGTRLLSEYGVNAPSRVRIPPSPLLLIETLRDVGGEHPQSSPVATQEPAGWRSGGRRCARARQAEPAR